MKSPGLRIVNWPLWSPAAALMRRFRFPGKMALISAAFMLPVLWLLANFLQAEREDLGFVAREREGLTYAQALFPALEAADQWRYAARRVALGGGADELAQAKAAFDSRWQDLQAVQGQLGGRLETAQAWGGAEQALQQASAQGSGDAQAIYEAMTGLSRSLTDLLGVVTDHSGLALDPEMGSYYLGSGTLLHAPGIIRRTGELRGLAGTALRAGRIEPAQALRLTELQAVLAHELVAAREDMDKARAVLGPAG